MVDNVLKVDSVEGRPGIIVYECMSGEIFHISPLNLGTLRAIQMKAQDMFPYPDEKPFRFPEENAFDPNQLTPARDNPEYVALCQAVDLQRAQWCDKAIFEYTAKMPKYAGREDLVRVYKQPLNNLKAIAKFDEGDSEYDLIMLNLVLTGKNDFVNIVRLAVQQLALTPAEVSAGIRFFRLDLQRTTS